MTASTLHLIFESAGYFAGGQLFWWQRRKQGDTVGGSTRWLVICGAIIGAALGSRLLAALEDPTHFSLAGKTIVGGLLGGLIGVELMKKSQGISESTGDLFAIPLAVGTAVGRIGCFLAGMEDQTYGLPTSLPWGHDFGDGLFRHPTQLYEVAFCLVLATMLAFFRIPQSGDRFKLFIVAYMAWRLLIDLLKPGLAFVGLTAIQWAALTCLVYYARDIRRWVTRDG